MNKSFANFKKILILIGGFTAYSCQSTKTTSHLTSGDTTEILVNVTGKYFKKNDFREYLVQFTWNSGILDLKFNEGVPTPVFRKLTPERARLSVRRRYPLGSNKEDELVFAGSLVYVTKIDGVYRLSFRDTLGGSERGAFRPSAMVDVHYDADKHPTVPSKFEVYPAPTYSSYLAGNRDSPGKRLIEATKIYRSEEDIKE